MSIDQLVAKLQKLSSQVEKGMSKHAFTIWIQMIRQDLFKIANPDVRKGALKLLTVVETAGFCLDKVPEMRESLILPNLTPLIDYLTTGVMKKAGKSQKPEPAKVQAVKQTSDASDDAPMEWGFSPSEPVEDGPMEWGYNPS